MTFSQQLALTLIGAAAPIAAVIVTSKRSAKAIQEIHLSINSRMDQLLQAKGESKRAEGVEAGRAAGVEEVQAIRAEVVETIKATNADSLKDMKTLLLLVAMTALALQR